MKPYFLNLIKLFSKMRDFVKSSYFVPMVFIFMLMGLIFAVSCDKEKDEFVPGPDMTEQDVIKHFGDPSTGDMGPGPDKSFARSGGTYQIYQKDFSTYPRLWRIEYDDDATRNCERDDDIVYNIQTTYTQWRIFWPPTANETQCQINGAWYHVHAINKVPGGYMAGWLQYRADWQQYPVNDWGHYGDIDWISGNAKFVYVVDDHTTVSPENEILVSETRLE